MNYEELKDYWKSEEKKSFQGWDFSYIRDRKTEEPLPWSYDTIVRQYLKHDYILLDMGTGGGEYLLTLNHPYPNTFATEAYLPNFELCKKKLVPLGIDVRHVVKENCLPFESNMFDIIINRHESFNVDEVYRLLKPGAMFVTQQVGGLNNKDLSKFLLSKCKEVIDSKFSLNNTVMSIENKGFTILKADEFFPKQKFIDIGALVYFAKIIEWEFPGFSVDRCFKQLCELQKTVREQGYVESVGHRFIIIAQKPYTAGKVISNGV